MYGSARRPSRRLSPQVVLIVVLLLTAMALAGGLAMAVRSSTKQLAPSQATVSAATSALGQRQQQVASLQTQVAQLQRRVDQLQRQAATGQTATPQAGSSHRYLATFQLDQYSYVVYMEWDESNGFIRDGRLLTTDNYRRRGSKSFQISGLDNAGSVGFTAVDATIRFTFSGTIRGDGTLVVVGLPWYVFDGFVGGTSTQVLHPGTRHDYDAAVSSLPAPSG